MYRSRQLHLLPVNKFDVAEISQAYRYFSADERLGKIVVSLEDTDSQILVCLDLNDFPPYDCVLGRSDV